MDINKIGKKARTDFNNMICLVGVIPFLTSIYILVNRIASIQILTADIGYIMLIAMAVLTLGVILGRKTFKAITISLAEFNRQTIKLQEELLEKNRLAAMTETALALSHEIHNPLLVMRGNLELMEEDFTATPVSDGVKERFFVIKNSCERLRQITNKMSNLSRPKTA